MSGLFLEKTVPQLHTAVERRELSFADLAEESIAAVQHHEAQTKAWVAFDSDGLRQRSRAAETVWRERGHLHGLDGLPFGAKDIFNTRDYPTQMGSSIWSGFTPGNNARVVDSLINSGALVAGKTVTAEFAVHALNQTLNPHDAARTPGTSSSGSAAAVATGMVPFALGSQTAGSIVRPASFCGVWGMKPSFGMIPRTGVLKTTDSLDTIGFLAAHGASLRPILDAVRVRGPNYPPVYRHVDARGPFVAPPTGTWRVGFIRTAAWEGADAYVRTAVSGLSAAIDAEPGFDVAEVPWSDDLEELREVHGTIYAKALSYYFQQEARHGSAVSPIMTEMIEAGRSIGGERYRRALERQVELAHSIDALLEPYDLVLSIGTSSAAPLRGDVELADPSLLWTAAHVPAVAVPAFRAPGGLPFGAQFISRRWNDYLLLCGIEMLVERGVLPAGSTSIARDEAASGSRP